jgi:hypothetical protein
MLDLTAEGRGADGYPKLDYQRQYKVRPRPVTSELRRDMEADITKTRWELPTAQVAGQPWRAAMTRSERPFRYNQRSIMRTYLLLGWLPLALLATENRGVLETLRCTEPGPQTNTAGDRDQDSDGPAKVPAADFVVEAGTRIPLSLVNSLNTTHSAPGDRVYLETAFPIVQNGRIVIPKGSYVAGTVTEVKRAGKMKGKAELFLRFDSLTLPNGVTREFRSRPDSADGHDVDRQEGKILGDSNKAGDARTVGEVAGAGATIGSVAGSVAGHAGTGAGIGVLGGAAAGLAAVLVTRGPDLVLPKGTTLEMVLDRQLHYEPRDLAVQP